MDSDGGISRCDAGSIGDCFKRFAVEFDLAENLAVCGLEFVEGPKNAVTGAVFCQRVWLGFGGDILRPAIEGAVFSGAMTVVVDDGVAQNAIEPGNNGISTPQT